MVFSSASRSFPFVEFAGGDTQCPSVTRHPVDLLGTGPVLSPDFFNHRMSLRNNIVIL